MREFQAYDIERQVRPRLYMRFIGNGGRMYCRYATVYDVIRNINGHREGGGKKSTRMEDPNPNPSNIGEMRMNPLEIGATVLQMRNVAISNTGHATALPPRIQLLEQHNADLTNRSADHPDWFLPDIGTAETSTFSATFNEQLHHRPTQCNAYFGHSGSPVRFRGNRDLHEAASEGRTIDKDRFRATHDKTFERKQPSWR